MFKKKEMHSSLTSHKNAGDKNPYVGSNIRNDILPCAKVKMSTDTKYIQWKQHKQNMDKTGCF